MGELKAEQMLSILTAAETEMYESSKKHEETMNKSGQIPKPPTKDVEVHVQLISSQDYSMMELSLKEMKEQSLEFKKSKKSETQEM